MILAFIAAGIGNFIRTKLIKHHYTLFLNIAASISAACLVYALLLKLSEVCFGISSFHEAGYICSMLFIIPGFPFITSGIDPVSYTHLGLSICMEETPRSASIKSNLPSFSATSSILAKLIFRTVSMSGPNP